MGPAKRLFVLVLLLFGMMLNFDCKRQSQSSYSPPNVAFPPALDAKVQRLLTFGYPDTIRNEFRFYGLSDIAVHVNGRVYVLDSRNCSVLVLSPQTGEELFRFGRKGQGPGELTHPSRLKYLPNRGIIVIDRTLYRATVFDEQGKALQTVPLRFITDDLVFLSDTVVVTSQFLLKPDFKPLRAVSASTGATLDEFGSIVEPQKGLFDAVKSSPFASTDVQLLSFGGMTRIVYDSASQLIVLSQLNPYALSKYKLQSRTGQFFQGQVPFVTEDLMEYRYEGNRRTAKLVPSARVLAPALVDTHLVVPVFSADCQENYLDCYNIEGSPIKRLRIPSLEKGAVAIAATFGPYHEMFLLVQNKDRISWIEKFKVEL